MKRSLISGENSVGVKDRTLGTLKLLQNIWSDCLFCYWHSDQVSASNSVLVWRQNQTSTAIIQHRTTTTHRDLVYVDAHAAHAAIQKLSLKVEIPPCRRLCYFKTSQSTDKLFPWSLKSEVMQMRKYVV